MNLTLQFRQLDLIFSFKLSNVKPKGLTIIIKYYPYHSTIEFKLTYNMHLYKSIYTHSHTHTHTYAHTHRRHGSEIYSVTSDPSLVILNLMHHI